MPEATDHKVIVQISDTHITASGNLHDTVDTLDNLSQILEAIEGAGAPLDLLLFTGDLADRGEPEAYRRFRSTVEPYAARMAVPAIYLPGNHDDRSTFRMHLLDWEENQEVADQIIWSDGLRVIALDSTVIGAHHGELDDDQLAWLDATLAAPAPLGTVIALHHPPIPGPSEFLNSLTLREPERLGEVIRDRGVTLITSGHAHHVSAGVLAGVPVWVATASAYQMDVMSAATTSLRGITGSAFTRIDVFSTGAVATHAPMLTAAEPVYEVDFATIARMIANGGATVEEIEEAFAPAGA